MSYIINNSRGEIIAVIPDGVVNTSATNLALIGQAVKNYGTYQNENYLYLLENFANGDPPTTPILGQLWYNANTDVLNSYSSANSWTPLASRNYVDSAVLSLLASPSFTGTPTAPTAPTGTNNAQIATTAFVNQTVGSFDGNITNAHLVGNSTAITATNGTATTQIATTEFVINQLSGGGGAISTSGNVVGGNVNSTGDMSATGNITVSRIFASGLETDFISLTGNVTSNLPVSGNITARNIFSNGVVTATGNITAPVFIGDVVGDVSGNISGNITAPGANTQILFNDRGIANATSGFTFNKTSNSVTIGGTLTVDTILANTVVNTGTSSAFRLPSLNQLQINALSPQNGDMVYNTTEDLPQIYQNGSWKNFTISYYS